MDNSLGVDSISGVDNSQGGATLINLHRGILKAISLKRAIITGASGFIGSHITRALVNNGWQVAAIVRQNSSLTKLNDIISKISLLKLKGDLENLPGIEPLLKDGVFIHCATAYARQGMAAEELNAVNVLWPQKIFDLCRKSGARGFINTHTFYPAKRDNYAASKETFRQWLQDQAKTAGFPVVSLVLQHVYGVDDGEEKFIPSTIKKLLKNELEIPLTAGEQWRDFIYVTDVAEAFHKIADLLERRMISYGFYSYDVGTEHLITLRQLVERLATLTASKSKLAYGLVPYLPGEIMQPEVSCGPLRALGWQAQVNLERGLRQTVDWIQKHFETANKPERVI